MTNNVELRSYTDGDGWGWKWNMRGLGGMGHVTLRSIYTLLVSVKQLRNVVEYTIYQTVHSSRQSLKQLWQVKQLMLMASARRWPSRPIDHCPIYTAPCWVSAIVVSCIGSNSNGSICYTTCSTACCATNRQEIEPMQFEPYCMYHAHLPSVCRHQRCHNTRLLAVTVYIALADCQYAVAKFSKCTVPLFLEIP